MSTSPAPLRHYPCKARTTQSFCRAIRIRMLTAPLSEAGPNDLFRAVSSRGNPTKQWAKQRQSPARPGAGLHTITDAHAVAGVHQT